MRAFFVGLGFVDLSAGILYMTPVHDTCTWYLYTTPVQGFSPTRPRVHSHYLDSLTTTFWGPFWLRRSGVHEQATNPRATEYTLIAAMLSMTRNMEEAEHARTARLQWRNTNNHHHHVHVCLLTFRLFSNFSSFYFFLILLLLFLIFLLFLLFFFFFFFFFVFLLFFVFFLLILFLLLLLPLQDHHHYHHHKTTRTRLCLSSYSQLPWRCFQAR